MEKMDIKKESIDLRGRILTNIDNNNPGPEFIGDTIIQELRIYRNTINENLEIYQQDIDFDLFRLPNLIIELDGELEVAMQEA